MKPEDDTPEDAILQQALRDSRRLLDAPESLIQRTIALFDARASAPAARPGLRQRLEAALRFDSAGLSPLAFGRRSGGGQLRQLVFTAAGHDIDLRVAPAGPDGSFTLSGQVLGPDSSGTVLLHGEAGQPAAQVELDELGEFRLAAVPSGTYRLTLDLAGVTVDLPPVRLPLPA